MVVGAVKAHTATANTLSKAIVTRLEGRKNRVGKIHRMECRILVRIAFFLLSLFLEWFLLPRAEKGRSCPSTIPQAGGNRARTSLRAGRLGGRKDKGRGWKRKEA